MNLKKYIRMTFTKCLIAGVILVAVNVTIRTVAPMLTNEIALGQMENSDGLFLAMEMYNQLRPIGSAISGVIILLFTCTIARDTYKFIKSAKENNPQ